MSGALVFAGTRVPAKIFVEHLEAGDALDDSLDGFPSVTRERAVAYRKTALEAAVFRAYFLTRTSSEDHLFYSR